MTPGIQPSKVKMRLRKKLAMRPVISTASGGSTTQKKYRSFHCRLFLACRAVGRRGDRRRVRFVFAFLDWALDACRAAALRSRVGRRTPARDLSEFGVF